MALNSLQGAEVLLRNCSLTHPIVGKPHCSSSSLKTVTDDCRMEV